MSASKRPVPLCCSLCRLDLPPDVALPRFVLVETQRDHVGRFCSQRCLDAIRALVALGERPWGLSGESTERRTRIAEALLVLWRRRRGPNPCLVMDAIRQADARTA